MKISLDKPFPRQVEFLTATARYVGYGGARGGGKSSAVQMKAILMALGMPGIHQTIVRRTMPEVRENHIKKLVEKTAGLATYNEQRRTLTFTGGSVIHFDYCETDADLTHYQGVETDILYIDEGTHFTKHQFDVMDMTVRGVNNYPKRTYITCNPGGVGHEWVKRLFIDREYQSGEHPEDYMFIRSSVRDNIPLQITNPGYINSLERLEPELRRRWLDGEWEIAEGRFFPGWKRETHVIEPFEIPPYWRRYRAIDYGLDRLVCLWAAADDMGNMVIYRELAASDLIVSDAAKAICDMSPADEHIEMTFAPPDLFGRQKDTGRSLWELFQDGGIDLTKSGNGRIEGWANLKEWLKVIPGEDGEERPRLRVFSTCGELIKCMPALLHDPKIVGDCLREPHEYTHAPDALRYLVQGRPDAAKKPKTETDWLRDLKHRRIYGMRKGD